MKFLLDANMPRSALVVLREAGHEANHVRDLGLGDATDAAIDDRARAMDAVIVSRDLDFADVRRFPPELRPGLLVLRMSDASTAADVVGLLSRVLSATALVQQIPGRLAILEPNRLRFRPALHP